MMELEQVSSAIQRLEQTMTELGIVPKAMNDSAAVAPVVAKAPAGQIMASSYAEHSANGNILIEVLTGLHADLARTKATLEAGSENATQVAQQGMPGGGGAGGPISSQMHA